MARIKIGSVFPPAEYLLKHCAPTGYGLGVASFSHQHPQDIDAVFKSGYYLLTQETANSSTEILHVLARTETECVQERFSTADNRYCRRYTMSGSAGWSEWEWDNPPMQPGEVYRTTERFRGKPVYTQLFDCGKTAPGTITKDLPDNIIPIRFAANADGTVSPYRPNGGDAKRFEVHVDRHTITITVGSENISTIYDTTAYVQIWYVNP